MHYSEAGSALKQSASQPSRCKDLFIFTLQINVK